MVPINSLLDNQTGDRRPLAPGLLQALEKPESDIEKKGFFAKEDSYVISLESATIHVKDEAKIQRNVWYKGISPCLSRSSEHEHWFTNRN